MARLINYASKLSPPYYLDNSTYDFIGQVRISHIEPSEQYRFHFTMFVKDAFINNNFGLDYRLDIQDPRQNDIDTIAFITCRSYTEHLRVIEYFDNRVYYGRRLTAKPAGFTNVQINDEYNNYQFMSRVVQRFNEAHYPGYRPYHSAAVRYINSIRRDSNADRDEQRATSTKPKRALVQSLSIEFSEAKKNRSEESESKTNESVVAKNSFVCSESKMPLCNKSRTTGIPTTAICTNEITTPKAIRTESRPETSVVEVHKPPVEPKPTSNTLVVSLSNATEEQLRAFHDLIVQTFVPKPDENE